MICDLWDSCEFFEQDMQNVRVFWGRQSVAERIDAIGKSSCGSWFAREAAVMSCQSCLEWYAETVWNGLKNSEGQEKCDSSLNIFISHDGEAWIDLDTRRSSRELHLSGCMKACRWPASAMKTWSRLTQLTFSCLIQSCKMLQDAQDVVQFSAQKDYSKCQMTGFDFRLDGLSSEMEALPRTVHWATSFLVWWWL